MKMIVTAVIAVGVLSAGTPAIAKSTKVNAQVVERDASGHATKVSVDGQVYAVCTPAVTDSCINPRQAGLNFGHTPLNQWPGQPAGNKDPGH